MTNPTVRVLSLGAGVQSSTLCYLYEDKIFKNPPDFAVFADTQAEPKPVYDFFKKLQREIKSFPIYVASKGDLKENPGKIPFFLKHPDGKRGMSWRQCTADYKIKVVNSKIREVLGYKPRQRWKHHVDVLIGISTDEEGRVKVAKDKWRTNIYPLIEAQWSRQDCLDFCATNGLKPPRSACVMCPYRSLKEWRWLKENDPEGFKEACDYDDWLRTDANRMGKSKMMRLPQYVSPKLVPLREVDLGQDDPSEQYNAMEDECEGMCGL